jgi:hypothetical protein
MGAGTVGAAMSIVAHSAVRDGDDKVRKAEGTYRSARSESEILDARSAIAAATHERDDKVEVRRMWFGFLGAVWIGAAIESTLLTPQPAFRSNGAESVIVDCPRAGGARAALRSAVFPGGGQRYMGRDRRAAFFTTACAALGASSIVAHDRYLHARRDLSEARRSYLRAETESEIRQSRAGLQHAAREVDDKNFIRWALLGAAGGVYVWNVLDAYGVGRDARGSAPDLTAMPTADGFIVAARWSLE